jgi:hypothetical protein
VSRGCRADRHDHSVRAILNRLADPTFLSGLENQAGRRCCGILGAPSRSCRLASPPRDRRSASHRWRSSLTTGVSNGCLPDRIVSDPEATRRAVELLDQIARPAPTDGNKFPKTGHMLYLLARSARSFLSKDGQPHAARSLPSDRQCCCSGHAARRPRAPHWTAPQRSQNRPAQPIPPSGWRTASGGRHRI